MTDPRVTTLPPAAQKAFDAAGTVIIETTEVLDQQKMMAAHPERAGPDDVHRHHDAVVAAVAGRGGGHEQGARRARHPAGKRRQDEAVDAVGDGGAAGLRTGPQGGRRAGARRQARRGRQGGGQGRRGSGNRRRPVARHGLAAARLPHEGAGRHAEARRPDERRQRDHDRALPARRHRHVLAAVSRGPARRAETIPRAMRPSRKR